MAWPVAFQSMLWNPIKTAAFSDTRIVHAPVRVVAEVFTEYLQRLGFRTHAWNTPPDDFFTAGVMVHRDATALRLIKGQPKRVSLKLSFEGSDTTKVQTRPTYGLGGEITLALIAMVFWGMIWWAWHLLIRGRAELQQGGDFAHVGALAPALIVGTVWIVGYTRLWKAGYRPSYFTEDLYKHLADCTGIRHFTESPTRIPLSAAVQMMINTAGLVGMIYRITWEIPARDRLLLAMVLLPLVMVPWLIVSVGRGMVRWSVGHAAFVTGVALVLYTLFPLMVLALSVEELKQMADTRAGMLWLFGCGVMLVVVGVGLLYAAVSHAARLVQAVDYLREHTESCRWVGLWPRLGLALIAFPFWILIGCLLLFSIWHSLLFTQSQLLGPYAWPHAVGFDQAGEVVGLWFRPIVGGLLGEEGEAAVGRWLVVIYLSPVLLWGILHGWAFAQEVWRYLTQLRLKELPSESFMSASWTELSRGAALRGLTLRISSSSVIEAYAVIAPLPFLPKLVVVSERAIKEMPRHCLVALLAHEVGHLRKGHTQIYGCMRLLSRILMMGPSMLTGLIKPATVLESQADAFAVTWLESHGRTRQDLIDALRLIEQDKMSPFLQRGLREGIAISSGPDADWLPGGLRAKIANEHQLGLVKRMAVRCRVLHYMTFHSDLANYTYSSLSERLKAIEALPKTICAS